MIAVNESDKLFGSNCYKWNIYKQNTFPFFTLIFGLL